VTGGQGDGDLPIAIEQPGHVRKGHADDAAGRVVFDADETPTALRPALPELPELAAELAGISEAANVIYDDEKLDTSP
jgi:hypothetical protein